MPEPLLEVLQLRLLVAGVMAPMNAAGSQTPFRMTAKERHPGADKGSNSICYSGGAFSLASDVPLLHKVARPRIDDAAESR